MKRYLEISDELKHKIVTGKLKKGSALPRQVELAEEYDTSRVTIQKALNILNREGLIITKKGIGTFVSEGIPSNSLLDSRVNKFQGVTEELRGKGKLTSEIISFEVRFPDEIEIEKLQLTLEEPVYDIIRLRFLNKEPILLEYTIMPVKVIPGITSAILKNSIYHYIQDQLQLNIGSAIRRLHADRPDAYDQKYLRCHDIDPILEVNQVVYLTDGRPFEYSQTRHRFDKGDIVYTSHFS